MRWHLTSPFRSPSSDHHANRELNHISSEARPLSLLETFLQDLRFGFRMLVRNPGFSVLAVVCLTIGIGANAAVFSWIEGVLFRPYPAVAHQDRMVAITGTLPTRDKGSIGLAYTGISWPDLQDFRRSSTLFDWFIVSRITGSSISIGERAQHVAGSIVSSNYFDALGIHPMLGRAFEPDEDWGRNGHPVTVISYWLWKERFHGDPNVVGQSQLLNGVPHTIVGVAPQGFFGTFVGYPIQFWVPVSMQEKFTGGSYMLEDRGETWIEGFARLKPGVSLEQAGSELTAVAKRLESEYPATTASIRSASESSSTTSRCLSWASPRMRSIPASSKHPNLSSISAFDRCQVSMGI